MPVQDVLYDGEPQSSAAALAAALHVDAVEALRQTRDGLAGNSLTLVLNRDEVLACTLPAGAVRVTETDAHFAALAAIFDRIVQQVLEDLRQLVAISDHD